MYQDEQPGIQRCRLLEESWGQWRHRQETDWGQQHEDCRYIQFNNLIFFLLLLHHVTKKIRANELAHLARTSWDVGSSYDTEATQRQNHKYRAWALKARRTCWWQEKGCQRSRWSRGGPSVPPHPSYRQQPANIAKDSALKVTFCTKKNNPI